MKVYRCILPALLVAMAGWQASARTIPVPTQPVSPFADTEVSTNVALHLYRTDARDVQLHIQLDGTATNNLEVAFGRDSNTNGVLDVSEMETVYGWRAGRYFIENVRAWERMEAEAAPGALCGVIDVHVAIGRDFRPSRFSATCGGGAGLRQPFVSASGMALSKRLGHDASGPSRHVPARRVGPMRHRLHQRGHHREVTWWSRVSGHR